jgi:hypothetical protein
MVTAEIGMIVRLNEESVRKWLKRYEAEGLEGLKDEPLPATMRAKYLPRQLSDENKLDAIGQLILVADQARMSLTHMAMAFVMAHLGDYRPAHGGASRRSARGCGRCS